MNLRHKALRAIVELDEESTDAWDWAIAVCDLWEPIMRDLVLAVEHEVLGVGKGPGITLQDALRVAKEAIA